MANEIDRKSYRLRVTNPVDQSQYVDIPVIHQITFRDMHSYAQDYTWQFNNGPNANRAVHTHTVKHNGTDDNNKLEVERIENVKLRDGHNYAQDTYWGFVNFDPPPSTGKDSSEIAHRTTHVVRYTKDNTPSGIPWIDVELIDQVSFRDRRAYGQEYIIRLNNKKGDDIGDIGDDIYTPKFVSVDTSLDLIDPTSMGDTGGINPPWRTDPFQNIVNVNWASDDRAWLFGHAQNGGTLAFVKIQDGKPTITKIVDSPYPGDLIFVYCCNSFTDGTQITSWSPCVNLNAGAKETSDITPNFKNVITAYTSLTAHMIPTADPNPCCCLYTDGSTGTSEDRIYDIDGNLIGSQAAGLGPPKVQGSDHRGVGVGGDADGTIFANDKGITKYDTSGGQLWNVSFQTLADSSHRGSISLDAYTCVIMGKDSPSGTQSQLKVIADGLVFSLDPSSGSTISMVDLSPADTNGSFGFSNTFTLDYDRSGNVIITKDGGVTISKVDMYGDVKWTKPTGATMSVHGVPPNGDYDPPLTLLDEVVCLNDFVIFTLDVEELGATSTCSAAISTDNPPPNYYQGTHPCIQFKYAEAWSWFDKDGNQGPVDQSDFNEGNDSLTGWYAVERSIYLPPDDSEM